MGSEQGTKRGSRSSVAPLLRYSVVLTLLWLLITDAEPGAWVVGVLAVPLAVWAALFLSPLGRSGGLNSRLQVNLAGLLRFIPFFLWQSLKGGWDTALFALHPKRRVRSGFFTYSIRLCAPSAQLFFVNVVSLLPGTVSAKLCGNQLTVHALDAGSDQFLGLVACEKRVAELFGQSLATDDYHPSEHLGELSE